MKTTGPESAPRAAGFTRRQALKAALAGVSLTLPIGISLGRGASAHAAPGPGACRKGCLYTADDGFKSLTNACTVGAASAYATSVLSYWSPIMLAKQTANLIGFAVCMDHATLSHKVKSFECNQPGCPNFDPERDHPACKSCPGHCCVAPSRDSGYDCCAVCCSPSGDGCESSSTVCGGGGRG